MARALRGTARDPAVTRGTDSPSGRPLAETAAFAPIARPIATASATAHDRADSWRHVLDLVVETLVLSEAELRERVCDLETERDCYRFYFQETLHALHAALAREDRRLQDRQRLDDELRELRAMVVAESYDDAAAVLRTDKTRHDNTAVLVQ